MQGWLKANSAAGYAGVSPRTLRTWLRKGLRHSRLSTGTILIKCEWIDEYLEGFEVIENRAEDLVNEVFSDFKTQLNTHPRHNPKIGKI
jgi:hypothetical protein